MRLFLLLILFSLLNTKVYSQKVYTKSAILKIEKFNSLNDDGMLSFEIGVRMSDCLESIELIDVDRIKTKKNIFDRIHDWWWFKVRRIYDFNITKTFTEELNEENYFLKDTDDVSEQIFMKCDLLQLKSVFSRKTIKKRLKIRLYSRSGKVVYEKTFILNKFEILEEGEVRLGIEPS